MLAIIGLGNPGQKYNKTRHNVGFDVLDIFYEEQKIVGTFQEKFNCLYLKVKIHNVDVLLIKPQKFMNLSGQATRPLLDFFKIDTSGILVIHDDLDLQVGQLRIRKGGSAGGHNGVQDLITTLGTADFCRLRVGIGKPVNKEIEIVSWVLGSFQKDEKEKIDDVLKRASEATSLWVKNGLEATQRQFN